MRSPELSDEKRIAMAVNTLELVTGVEYTTIRRIPIRLSQILEDRLRYLSPAATSFNPYFASGRWDGFVRLYDRVHGRFPTGLLYRVTRILKELNVPYEITNGMPPLPPTSNRAYIPEFELRPYQTEAVTQAGKWRRGVIHIPTGGGKTEVAQSIIHQYPAARVVFLVPSVAILLQTVRRFRRAFPGALIVQWGAGERPSDHAPEEYICVATVQSAFKREHPLLTNAGMVFVDESHHQSAETFQQATRSCRSARYLFGLSATPYRHDGTDLELEAWIGPIIYSVGYEHLIQNGWLVPPEFHKVFSLEEGLELTRGKRTIIFSEKVEDLDNVRSVFERHRVQVVTGNASVEEREKHLRRLRDGEITHIAATPLFDEGLNIPNIDAVFFYSTCGSRVRAIQRIGRAMRPAPGKTKCYVVDLMDDKYYDRLDAYMLEPAFASRVHGVRDRM